MLFAAPPPPPVSFSRDIAPIFAMHCNGCHGDAGGLSTRSYRELMLGGNFGKIIIPGDPDRSVFLHFLDGRRGERQRMPKHGRPLAPARIDAIRRWIAEGARNDDLPVRSYRMTRAAVPMEPAKVTRIFCRVNTPAYLVISARDPGSGSILWSDVASVKAPKEGMDAGEPGELISWDLRAGTGWPNTVTLELSINYAAGEPTGADFYTEQIGSP
jgi:hypothetical protein